MPSFRLLLLIAFAVSSVCRAQTDVKPPAPKPVSDVLIFTNGDKLTGKLERAVGGNVVFKSDMAGELTVPFSKVKELRSGSEFVALRAGKPGKNKAIGTGSVTVAGDTLTLTSTTGTAQTLPSKDLGFLIDVQSYAKEVDRHASFRRGWTGSATAGLTLVRSTETGTTFSGALNFVRQIPTVAYLPLNHRTTINLAETYGTNSTPVIPQTTPIPSPPTVVRTNIFHADSERDQYFNPHLYALADLSYDHNFSQGLQLQQIYGGGVGWTPVQDSHQELDLKADVHYERQQFLLVSSNEEIIGSTFQENYRRSLPRKAVFTEWANILPAWNETQAYSANAYLSLAMPVFKRLAVKISATDNYLNNPSPGYRTNSVQFITGVSYLFK